MAEGKIYSHFLENDTWQIDDNFCLSLQCGILFNESAFMPNTLQEYKHSSRVNGFCCGKVPVEFTHIVHAYCNGTRVDHAITNSDNERIFRLGIDWRYADNSMQRCQNKTNTTKYFTYFMKNRV